MSKVLIVSRHFYVCIPIKCITFLRILFGGFIDSGFEYQRGTNASCSKNLKRGYEGSSCCYSQGEAYEGFSQKFRRSGKEGRRLQVLGTSLEKVDYCKENINETQGLQINDTCSVISSSGSCSTNSYNPNEVYSDAESVNSEIMKRPINLQQTRHWDITTSI